MLNSTISTDFTFPSSRLVVTPSHLLITFAPPESPSPSPPEISPGNSSPTARVAVNQKTVAAHDNLPITAIQNPESHFSLRLYLLRQQSSSLVPQVCTANLIKRLPGQVYTGLPKLFAFILQMFTWCSVHQLHRFLTLRTSDLQASLWCTLHQQVYLTLGGAGAHWAGWRWCTVVRQAFSPLSGSQQAPAGSCQGRDSPIGGPTPLLLSFFTFLIL